MSNPCKLVKDIPIGARLRLGVNQNGTIINYYSIDKEPSSFIEVSVIGKINQMLVIDFPAKASAAFQECYNQDNDAYRISNANAVIHNIDYKHTKGIFLLLDQRQEIEVIESKSIVDALPFLAACIGLGALVSSFAMTSNPPSLASEDRNAKRAQ